MKKLLTGLLVLAGLFSFGMENSVVFRMDFDSPVQIGSDSLDAALPSSGFVPGKFGKGYYFQRSSFNFLPPGAAEPSDKTYFTGENGCTLTFADGVLSATQGRFRMKETAVTLWNRRIYFMKPMTALTFSCWVKGPKDSKVTLNVEFVPEEVPAKKSDPVWKKFEKNKYVVPDPAYAGKFRPDIPGKKTFALSGEWQKFAVSAETDIRSASLRSLRAVGSAEIQSSGKVQFKKMQMEHTMFYPFHNCQPTTFLPGQSGRPQNESGVQFSLDSIRKNFPVKEGTVSFFMKTPMLSNESADAGGFFCYGGGWRTPLWCVDNGRNVAGTKEAVYLKKPSLTYREWTHYAMTWNEKEMTVYLNGKKIRSSGRKFQEFSPAGYVFCVGKNIWPQTSANAVMDEFLIFSKALTPEEVAKLASAEKPFASAQKTSSIQVRPFAVPRFYRNDPDAGITLEVVSEKAQQVTAEFSSDFHKESRQIALKKGENIFKLAFHPELKSPGKGKWNLRISDRSGVLYQKEGDYSVEPALRKDLMRFLSWGGDGAVPFDYEKRLGINARNAFPRQAEPVFANGMMLSLDLRNHRELPKNNFDLQKTADVSRDDVREFRDCFAWYGTMLNSESIGSWTPVSFDKYPVLMKRAEKELGFRPACKSVKLNPDICTDRSTMNFDDNGVFTPGDAWKTLYWFRTKGDMIYHLDDADGKMVKSFQPENLVWTEPAYPGLFNTVDMGADWAYMPELHDVAGRLRKGWSAASVYNKYYQPTLTMYYWINGREQAVLNGRTYYMPRSVDHLIADCWAAAGVAPMHDLCFFNTYAWYDAENGSKEYLPMKGMSEAFGKFVKEKYYPAALLLRDMKEPQAKVALFLPEDIAYYSDVDWNYQRITVQWLRSLSQWNIHFDVVGGEKLRKDGLGAYTTIIVPMRSKASVTAHDALMKASAKAKIVVDDYCPAVYPNMVKLNYKWSKYDFETFAPCDDFVKQLSASATGRSVRTSGNKGRVMVFEKVHQKVRYFIVINNAWSDAGYLGKYSKLKRLQGLDFKPHGVAQEATVTFEPVSGNVVYDFLNSAGVPGAETGSFTAALGPGEGKVFCVYPEKLSSLKVALQDSAAPGKTCYLVCRMNTVSGKQAPGRQLLTLTLRDGAGKVTDESGFYVMENGMVRIPVRIALDSAPGNWKAELSERTTGLKASLNFKVGK